MFTPMSKYIHNSFFKFKIICVFDHWMINLFIKYIFGVNFINFIFETELRSSQHLPRQLYIENILPCLQSFIAWSVFKCRGFCDIVIELDIFKLNNFTGNG